MSREEAAAAYLDVLLGFRNDYQKYREAEDTLNERDKALLRSAVFGHPGRKKEFAEAPSSDFFSRIN